MSDQQLWKKIDQTSQGSPHYLNLSTDSCYYAREYVSRGGIRYPGNDRIENFKKNNRYKNNPTVWKWKILAVQEFAKELADFIPDNGVLAFMPTSKISSDSDFDERFELLKVELSLKRSDVVLIEPIILKANVDASHLGGSRDPKSIKESYQFTGFSHPIPSHLFVIDDVISSGGHFKAYKNLILDNYENIQVDGVFWALTVTHPLISMG